MKFIEAVKAKEKDINRTVRRKSKPEYILAVDLVFYHISKDEIKYLRFDDINATDWEVIEDKVIPLSEKEISWQEQSNKYTTHQGFINSDVKEAVKELKRRFAGSGYNDVRSHIKKVLEEIFGDLVE